MDDSAMPIDINDFPDIVQLALHIYNSLRDTFIPGELPMFIGKDLSALPALFDIYEITTRERKEFILDVINIFDAEAVAVARKRIEAAKTKSRVPPNITPGRRKTS